MDFDYELEKTYHPENFEDNDKCEICGQDLDEHDDEKCDDIYDRE